MKKNLHDIDKLFNDALEGQEETPSASVWDAIDKNLDKNKVVDINRKYLQLKRVAAALLIILMGIGAYTLNTWNKYEKIEKSNNPKPLHQQKNDTGDMGAVIKIERPPVDDSVAADKNAVIANIKPGTKAENELKNPIADDNDITDQAPVQTGGRNAGNLKNNNTSSIAVNRRTWKATITNGSVGEEENSSAQDETAENNSTNNSNQLEKLAPFNPGLIKTMPDQSSAKNIVSRQNVLPANLILQPMPFKKYREKKPATFSVTAFYAPNFSSNRIAEETRERRPGGPATNREREKIRNGEQHQSSATFGLLVDYHLTSHWSVQSGIAVTNKTIDIEPKTIYARPDYDGKVKYLFDCSSGYLFLTPKSGASPVAGDSVKALKSTNSLQYASVPLAVKYTHSFGKVELFSSVGAAVNILTKGKLETAIQNTNGKEVTVNNNINGLQPNYISGNVSLGTVYNLNDKLGISFAPSYNFALNSSTRDAAVKSFPNSISLAAGLRFRL